ncbi:thioredoxin domain-containing protein [Candidatus Micrarchaeota archaeon]|nr:thioredoxin domain-containing protein [Candidatus Micrarchaeota archaeon]
MTEQKEESGDKITVNKSSLYFIVLGVLAILLIASVFTQGFGLVKPTVDSKTGGTTAPAPSQPSVDSGTSLIIDSMLDDDVKLGSDDAPVIIVEFSDFQCPYCRKFWKESFSKIDENYIKTGKVQYVFRDFPLSFHPAAPKAAEAAECSRDQNKWEEMHNKMFAEQEKQGPNTVSFSEDDMKKWAEEIGLDSTKFNECLDSGKYADEVQKDFIDGNSIGVSGTPAFLIGKRGGDAQPLVGAQPYSVFKQAIDSMLE